MSRDSITYHANNGRPQGCLEAVEGAFGPNIAYAMLIKMYEGDSGKDGTAERRYSPAVCTGSREQTITAALDSLTWLARPG